MVDTLRNALAKFIAPRLHAELEERAHKLDEQERLLNETVNQRVAAVLSHMDPFEPLMKEFRGIFSEEFEHPEDKLDARSQLLMRTWGYQQSTDPSFRHMIDWIINTQANETLRHALPTPDRILYGRAQISGMLLFKREVQRLSNAYEEKIQKRDEEFDSASATE